MKGPLSCSSPTSFTPGKRVLLSYGFWVEELRPLEGWLHGWRGASAQRGRRHGSCTWRWGQACPVCPPFHWPPRIPCPPCPRVRETRLTRQMGGHHLRAPPLHEGVRETQGEHNKNHRLRGIIAKDQENVRLFFHYQIVKKKNKKTRKTKKTEQNPSGFVAGEATLAVTARRCGRRDFQVLAENGLEGLVSMHHGTEHQRLAGWRRRGDSARPGWREDKTPRHTGLAWPQARPERSPTGSGA